VIAIYGFSRCEIAVNTTCAKCNEALVNSSLKRGNPGAAQIAQCPSCKGKMKSPTCFGSKWFASSQKRFSTQVANVSEV
jgi:NAD-dependent SIR2 family protein deacetylase